MKRFMFIVTVLVGLVTLCSCNSEARVELDKEIEMHTAMSSRQSLVDDMYHKVDVNYTLKNEDKYLEMIDEYDKFINAETIEDKEEHYNKYNDAWTPVYWELCEYIEKHNKQHDRRSTHSVLRLFSSQPN